MKGLGVKRLDLESPKLTDEVLKNATLLPELYDLTLSSTDKLTSTGFKNLHNIKELRILVIENCKVSPDMMKEISNLNQLFSLSLKGCKSIKDSDLEILSKMSGLNNLAIDFTSITPYGLKVLSKFKNLHSLKCEFLGITDNEIPILMKLPLVSLDISDNKITDKGLMLLAENKNLVKLDAMNQSWMNDKTLSEDVLSNRLAKYKKAAMHFMKSNPNRKIRWKFGSKDPCK